MPGLFKNTGLILIAMLLFLFACNHDHSPLPRGYFRIALPERDYREFDTLFPYQFTYPDYANIVPDERADAESYWADMVFPEFSAVLHLSYKTIDDENTLNEYIEDGRSFVNRHIPKATGFQERVYAHDSNRVYGILYEIKGREAATPLQFYLTDSTKHFLRGALYFNVTPNNDSLSPVINFIQEDIMLMIESLEWKDNL